METVILAFSWCLSMYDSMLGAVQKYSQMLA